MMGRIRGLLALVDLGYQPDELFVEDQINEVYQDLTKAMKNPIQDLFKEVSVAGRMQKLDIELIRYLHKANRDITNAARVAIRMLVEDEYVFPEAELEAVKMLLIYMNTADDQNVPEDADGRIVKELRSIIASLEHDHALSIQKLQLSYKPCGSTLLMRSLRATSRDQFADENSTSKSVEDGRASAVRESMKGDFTMEFF